MWCAAGGMIVAGIIGAGMLMLNVTPLVAPIESLNGGALSIIGFYCMVVVIFGGIDWWRRKMWRKWPKTLVPPSAELTPSLFTHPKTIGADKRKEILQRIINHPNSAVQQCTGLLSPLQHLQLPDAWWWAVEEALNTIPLQDATCTVVSAQHELDEVFVEIEQKTQKSPASKLLKV